jgi:hypothetical protein
MRKAMWEGLKIGAFVVVAFWAACGLTMALYWAVTP